MAEFNLESLLADLKSLQALYPGTRITRKFYRAYAGCPSSLWENHFDTFAEFLIAAGVDYEFNAGAEIEPSEISETNEVAGNTWTVSLPKTRIQTLDELLAYCKVDLMLWEVERFIVNKWEMGAKNADKQIVVEPLFQVKATLKRKTNAAFAVSEIEDLKRAAKEAAVPKKPVIRPVYNTGNMLEINIVDHHFGKLAWSGDTGSSDYNLEAARELYLRAIEGLLSRAFGYAFDGILFVVGNDLLNADDQEGRTTSGTYVSNDGRYQKTFACVRRTVTEVIERLRLIAPVKVVMIPGNHDNLSVWHLGDSLECYFDKYEDVQIDNRPLQRKYHQHGDVMLMLTHGHRGKKEDYPLLMATEQPAMFGSTKFREAHTGHTHETKTLEKHGVRVRVLPALCPADFWHADNTFVGNMRSAEGYVWNAKQGLIMQVFYNEDAN